MCIFSILGSKCETRAKPSTSNQGEVVRIVVPLRRVWEWNSLWHRPNILRWHTQKGKIDHLSMVLYIFSLAALNEFSKFGQCYSWPISQKRILYVENVQIAMEHEVYSFHFISKSKVHWFPGFSSFNSFSVQVFFLHLLSVSLSAILCEYCQWPKENK